MPVDTDGVRSVIAIDPGLVKCGLVFLEQTDRQRIERSVVATERLVYFLTKLLDDHPSVSVVVMGSGTGSGTLARAIRASRPEIKLLLVDEKGTSLLARQRYFKDNPPKGWKKLIPTTLQVPQEPIDDYAALLLAERYIGSLGG